MLMHPLKKLFITGLFWWSYTNLFRGPVFFETQCSFHPCGIPLGSVWFLWYPSPYRSLVHLWYRPQFLSELHQIWNVGLAHDNKDQIRWPVTLLTANVHRFTSCSAHFRLVSMIALTFLIQYTAILIYIWYVDSVCQDREQVLSVT